MDAKPAAGDEQLDTELKEDFQKLVEDTKDEDVRKVLCRNRVPLVSNGAVSKKALQALRKEDLTQPPYMLRDGDAATLKLEFPSPTTTGTSNILWQRVHELRKMERKVPSKEHRTTGEMSELLRTLYKEDLWRAGTMPDLAERTKELAALPSVDYLGDVLKYVGRTEAVQRARAGMLLIREHMDLSTDTPLLSDRVKHGTYRQAIVAAPGTGKTAFAEIMCHLVAKLPARNESEEKLQRLLKSCISKRLQYRMDLSEPGNGRLHEEDGKRIDAKQSLALRLLYMFCGGASTFRQFMTDLIAEADSKLELVARVLAQLEERDVIFAACTALQVTDPTALHFILDECQEPFEANPEMHKQPGSNVAWFKEMMSAHAVNVPHQQHLVLLTLVGTHMDIASVGQLSVTCP